MRAQPRTPQCLSLEHATAALPARLPPASHRLVAASLHTCLSATPLLTCLPSWDCSLQKESVEGGGCSKYLALFAQNTGTAAPADPCNVETVPPQLGSEFTYGTPLPYVFALPDSLLKSNGGPWEDEWISTGLTRVEKGAMNIMCGQPAGPALPHGAAGLLLQRA